ncbi:MAG: response regulator transcription factor [Bacteroidetes bacterium]|nr:response regulator transcription factor [Bacteroidota bacterium]
MKVLIIEDENSAAKRLEKLIKEIEPTFEIVETLDSVEGAVEWLENNEDPELIFMDIHLSDGSSFEIFKETHIKVPVIFTTAYDEYAIQAFKVNSVDYLLKPIKKQELRESLDKFFSVYRDHSSGNAVDIQQLLASLKNPSEEFQKRILIKYGQHIKAIEISETAYFYVDSRITFMKTHGGKNYPVDYNLDQLEGILDPKQFFRINRKFIINIDAISQMYAYSKSRVKVELIPDADDETIVSSERSSSFKKWLTGIAD